MGRSSAPRGVASLAAAWAIVLLTALAYAGEVIDVGLDAQQHERQWSIGKSDLHPSDSQECPVACAGTAVGGWTVYRDLDRLATCNSPLLFDFALSNPIADATTPTKVRVCAASVSPGELKSKPETGGSDPSSDSEEEVPAQDDVCAAAKAGSTSKLFLSQQGTASSSSTDALIISLEALEQHYVTEKASCGQDFLFSGVPGAVAGLYVGSSFGHGTVSSVLQAVIESLRTGNNPESLMAQFCGKRRNADHAFGLIATTTGDIATLQDAVKTWSIAQCTIPFSSIVDLGEVSVWEAADEPIWRPDADEEASGEAERVEEAEAVGPCEKITVVAGDTCNALAARCGLIFSAFASHNGGTSVCSKMVPGLQVCCTAGGLGDLAPKPDEDGTCAVYLIAPRDTCSSIAAPHGLTVEDVEKFNEGSTQDWHGCDKLLVDTRICLSEGRQPALGAKLESENGDDKVSASVKFQSEGHVDL